MPFCSVWVAVRPVFSIARSAPLAASRLSGLTRLTAVDPNSPEQAERWRYYDLRAREGVRTVGHALNYWAGLGVKTTAAAIEEEAGCVQRLLRSLAPTTFAELGAGPGTYTADLPGIGVAVDQSDSILRVLRSIVPQTPVVRADARRLPMRDQAVERVFCTQIYGLLTPPEREALVREVRRVADDLVVLDAGRPEGVPGEHWQQRTISGGEGPFRIYRRHFRGDELADELRGEALYSGQFYVLVHTGWATADHAA